MASRSPAPSEGARDENTATQSTNQAPASLENAAVAGGPVPTQPEPMLNDGQDLSRVVSAPYTVFPRSVKVGVTGMVAIASMISPMTANIYFPALNSIAKDLDVSTSLINLTLTTYMIFQGLSPTVLGDLGDMAGRRPAYITGFIIYIGANVGLALQRNYAALLVLRCLQSAGSSGTLALGFAVIADLAPRAERGKYMGYIGAAINLGPTLGPFLGGLLSQYLGWASLFWFLAILTVAWLVPWILFVPETGRSVVGNGSFAPPRWNRTLMDCIKHRKGSQEMPPEQRPKLRIPNPLGTLVVTFEKEMGSILLIASMIYLCFILVAATLSTLFKEIYGYDDLQVGLCYLPYGVGCCVTSVVQGYFLDWNYGRIAKKVGFDMRSREKAAEFPIETARIQPLYPPLTIGAAALIGYGWALYVETTVAVPLVLLFIIGMMIPTSFNVLNTLIVDLFPEAPATAAAANNLVRCLFGAVATAVIDKMLKGMGRGWCFTFLALLMVACIPWLWFIEKRGPRWRAAKAKRREMKELERTSNTHANEK
ncbi:hypothetical protein K4F52_003714 [Lecanicillium sp. MT-2017a]|nr:hypothetical protein K4F52_003714 [Lecanicillium sp. MT-2017a]